MMAVRAAAEALQADWSGRNAVFAGVSTDSRTLGDGDLFVALVGERFDGHEFLAAAAARGAAAAMVARDHVVVDGGSDLPLIQVPDTRLGLGRLAAAWRDRFGIPVVAVTGSNGKTTVKEMIACILRQTVAECGGAPDTGELDRVLATAGNFNNDIGVPLTLLRLRDRHRYAVIEMGMNRPGEIAYLTRLARPGVALVINAGAAHVQGLGSLEAVARAKGEIFEGLDPYGIAVINADDPYAERWRTLAGSRAVVDFGLTGTPTVGARCRSDFRGSDVTLLLPGGGEEVRLQVPGLHNVRNALAAAAAAVALGIGGTAIASGLAGFRGMAGRMQAKRGLHGATLMDDSYNASPESVKAALAVLAKAPGRKILVLGDMGELGDAVREFHARIGAEARTLGIDELLALGEASAHAVVAFGKGARHFVDVAGLLAELRGRLAADVTVLVKGSRFMRMERVVKNIEQNHE